MCISPISIKNPNYGLKLKYKDTKSHYIRVPCGFCSECIASKQMQMVQRIQMESVHNHLFFCTLTYSNKTLPIITTSSGFDIRFADYRDVVNMVKRLRKLDSLPSFRYFAVSELGSKRGRPHFHVLFLVSKRPQDKYVDCLNLEKLFFDSVLCEWRRNYGSTRNPNYVPLCDYKRVYTRNGVRSNFDLHYVNPASSVGGVSDVAFYVIKYMMKPSDRAIKLQRALKLNLDEDEYNSIWKLVRPRSFKSLRFGDDSFDNINKTYITFDVEDYIRSCINSSRGSDYPTFINPVNGSRFPLARYYRDRFFRIDDCKDFKVFTNPDAYDDKHISQLLKSESDYEKKKKFVSNRDLFSEFDDDNILFNSE